MKKSIMAMLLISTISSAFAYESTLDLTYHHDQKLTKDEVACLRVGFGCSKEEMLDLLQKNGKILSRNDLEDTLHKDTAKSYFIPLSLDNEELITLAAATSRGIVAFKYDQELMDVVQNNQTQVTEKIETVGNFLGSKGALFPLVAGSYFLGVLYKENKLKQVGLFTVGASMASGLVTMVVKETFNRKRPKADEGPYEFFAPGNKSFFSGHTAEAFTMATVISELYKEDYPIVPYVAYGVASITAYARMHDKAHWASDVLIGAVAGHLITKLAMNAFSGNQEGRGGLTIYPSIDPKTGSYMVMLDYTPKTKEALMKCSKIENKMSKIDACIAEALEKK